MVYPFIHGLSVQVILLLTSIVGIAGVYSLLAIILGEEVVIIGSEFCFLSNGPVLVVCRVAVDEGVVTSPRFALLYFFLVVLGLPSFWVKRSL